ncbi:hypothetical protein [Variovorax sp. J31P207]|uniref:hypothetical protein n=1 Tax=Variovorax sp. J31P207 TaxID=3053510 RepID=UPI002575EE52|nr:hypothetical protein [Variovorax sp. J31P207]MDM0066475.1 hypothetical protein [Variovorax sp. J31P207]
MDELNGVVDDLIALVLVVEAGGFGTYAHALKAPGYGTPHCAAAWSMLASSRVPEPNGATRTNT